MLEPGRGERYYFLNGRLTALSVSHGTHGLSRSMDSILRPWIKYVSMEMDTFLWSYSTHLIDISKILNLYSTSLIINVFKIYKKINYNLSFFYL